MNRVSRFAVRCSLFALRGSRFAQNRRPLLIVCVCCLAPWIIFDNDSHHALASADLGFSFTNIGSTAGLTARTIYGSEGSTTYLIETSGTGVACFDYDGDGWLDIFQGTGTTLAGFPKGQAPTNHP